MNVCRRSAIRAATRAAGIPIWSSDIRPIRGVCRGRVKRKPCGSRWGVPRVSIDFRDPERVDRLATIECASCGRTWRRVKTPPIRSREGYQAVYLTIILPAKANRWFSRGRWHREGDDGIVLRNADLGDVDEAARAHSSALAKRLDAKAAARERKAREDSEASARLMAAIREADERHAREAEAEREAELREAAYRA